MCKQLVYRLYLTDLDEIVHHRNNLKQYILNHVGARFDIEAPEIKVIFRDRLYFTVELTGKSVIDNWILGRTQLFLERSNLRHDLLQFRNTDNLEYGNFCFNNGELYAFDNPANGINLVKLTVKPQHLYLNRINLEQLRAFTFSEVYILGDSVGVRKVKKFLDFHLNQRLQGIDEELWLALRVVINKHPKVKIVSVINNTAIDLIELEYLQSTDLIECREFSIQRQLKETLLTTQLDSYINLSDYSLKSFSLLNQISKV